MMLDQQHDHVDTGPAVWQADLDHVRAAYPLQRRVIDGHSWEFLRCGDGREVVLVLPGGLAAAETAFRYIRRLAPRYQVLALAYPETAATMGEVVDGLAGLLRAEGIDQIHLVGGSYSGLVAQCLVRRAPALVRKLVLSDTGVPRPARAWQYAPYQPLMAHLPLPLVHQLLRAGVALSLVRLPSGRGFWWRYFSQRIAAMSRAACLSHLSVWLDFDRNYRFAPGDLAGWGGQLLIIAAEDDQLFRQPEQLALRRLYPEARLHAFERSSHCASLARMDDYITVIERFLDDAPEHEQRRVLLE